MSNHLVASAQHLVNSDLTNAFAHLEIVDALTLGMARAQVLGPPALDQRDAAPNPEVLHHAMHRLTLNAEGASTSTATPAIHLHRERPTTPTPIATDDSRRVAYPSSTSTRVTPTSSKRRRKPSTAFIHDRSFNASTSPPPGLSYHQDPTTSSLPLPVSIQTPPTNSTRSRHHHSSASRTPTGRKHASPTSSPGSSFRRPKLPRSFSSGWSVQPQSPQPPSSPPAPLFGRYSSSPTPRGSVPLSFAPMVSTSASSPSMGDAVGGRKARKYLSRDLFVATNAGGGGGGGMGDAGTEDADVNANANGSSALLCSALLMRGGGGVRPVKVRRIASCPRLENMEAVERPAEEEVGRNVGRLRRSSSVKMGRERERERERGYRGYDDVRMGGDADVNVRDAGENVALFVHSLRARGIEPDGNAAMMAGVARDGTVWMDSLANNVLAMRLS